MADEVHKAAGLLPDGFLVPDQHEAARGEHRFGPGALVRSDEFQGAHGQLLDHGRAVTGDQLPGRARGGVVAQRLLGFDQGHAAFAGEGGSKGQAGNAAAHDHNIVIS